MELITLQKTTKQNDFPHGGKHIFWINSLPVNSGTSCTISPRTHMTGTTIDFNEQYKIGLGAYAKAHKKNSHKSPRIPAQNPLYASDQHATSKVPTGSSNSTQDAASNDVPSPLYPPRHALSTAYTQLPTLTNRIPLLISLHAL